MSRKLPPPKGADDARDALLRNRFSDREPPSPQSEPATAPSTPAPVSPSPTPRRRGTRPEPAGMTRRTYYYSAAVADQLAAAVNRIVEQLGGRVDRHEVLDAIITAGVTRSDEVATALTEQLLQPLTRGSHAPHTRE